MRLQVRFLLSIFFVILFFLSLGGTIMIISLQNSLENQVVSHLDSVSELNKEFVLTFLEEHLREIGAIATQENLTYDELVRLEKLEENFFEISVLDSEGINIVSSEKGSVGLNESEDSYFLEGLKGNFISKVYISKEFGKASIVFSTPFKKGVLIARMGLDSFENLISNYAGLGESGESLMAFKNSKGDIVFFSKRRHPGNFENILSGEINELPISKALEGKEEIFLNFRDYRDEPVIASTRYLEVLGVGIVTKIDKKEAFREVQSLKNKLIIFLGVFLFLISLLVIFISRSISKELVNLSQNIERITRGELDVSFKKSKIFEINKVIDSLNRILASLKLAILRKGLRKEEIGLGEAIEAKNKAEKRAEKRSEQLERFAKLAINREEKMIQLKKRIKELELNLEKSNKNNFKDRFFNKVNKKRKKDEKRS